MLATANFFILTVTARIEALDLTPGVEEDTDEAVDDLIVDLTQGWWKGRVRSLVGGQDGVVVGWRYQVVSSPRRLR
jgi:hypothetical protein